MLFKWWEVSLQVEQRHTGIHLYFHALALTFIELFLKIVMIYCLLLLLAQFSKVSMGRKKKSLISLIIFLCLLDFTVTSRCFAFRLFFKQSFRWRAFTRYCKIVSDVDLVMRFGCFDQIVYCKCRF